MMAEQQDVLAKPLPTPVAPSGKGRVGFKEAIGVQQPFLARQAEIQPEIAKAEADIAKGQQEQKEIKSTGELSAQMRFGQQQEAAMQGYQEKIEKEPLPAFIPSKDNAQDIAGLFGVISVISMLVGGGGRMSGQLALGNMNGMMEGYRKGRKDLYEKERSEFDKNFKSMIQKHAEFRQEMEDAVKLAATNKEEGFRAAEMAAVKAGSPIVQAMLRRGRLIESRDLVKESGKGAEHALQMEAKAREQEAKEKQHRAEMAQRERMARERMTHTEKMKELKGVAKPASATNERYANTVYRSSNEVLRSLELVEKIGITTGGGVLGTVVGKGTIPSEVQRYIGQAMTDEQQKNYNTAMSGIALELAYVLGGGYKPDVNTVNKLETLLSVGPNDSYGNAAYKFADVTAKLKAAVDVSPAYTEEQKNTKQMLQEKMNRYATPEQVQERIYGAPRIEEPAVRAGKVYEPNTDEDFSSIPGGELYKDPADGKIYRKKK
jgi:cell pole-organizing protein PopZ